MLYPGVVSKPGQRPWCGEGHVDTQPLMRTLEDLKQNDGIVRDYYNDHAMVRAWPVAILWIVAGDLAYAPLDSALRDIGWMRSKREWSEPIERRFLVGDVLEELWEIAPDWDNTTTWPVTPVEADDDGVGVIWLEYKGEDSWREHE